MVWFTIPDAALKTSTSVITYGSDGGVTSDPVSSANRVATSVSPDGSLIPSMFGFVRNSMPSASMYKMKAVGARQSP